MKRIIVFVVFCLLSCKSVDHQPTLISINFKCLNDDIVRVFYTDQDNQAFTTKNMLSKTIKGKNEFQNLTFEISKQSRLNSFRIDLGENQVESKVYVKEIVIKYGNKELSMSKEKLARFFKENIYVTTKDYFEFERKKVGDRYDPFLKSTALLEQHMYLKFR